MRNEERMARQKAPVNGIAGGVVQCLVALPAPLQLIDRAGEVVFESAGYRTSFGASASAATPSLRRPKGPDGTTRCIPTINRGRGGVRGPRRS